MISPGTRRLWCVVILQALKDAKGLRPIGYDGESGSYSQNEAINWLNTEGKALMLLMGFPIERVNETLEDPATVISRFEEMGT